MRQRLGLAVTVKDIFNFRTVKNIALKAKDSEHEIITEQGILKGAVKLLPIQRWFFTKAEDGSFRKPGHFNQAFTIETPQLDVELLKISVRKLVEHHDAFRLRYRREKDGSVYQYYTQEAVASSLKVKEISGKRDEDIERIFDFWQDGFDIYGDELYSIGYLSLGGKGLIHIAMHHLIVDAVSWRIIKNDLEKIYGQLEAGRQAGNSLEELESRQVVELLGDKGTSYRQWADYVERLGQGAVNSVPLLWKGIIEEIHEYQKKLDAKFSLTEKPKQCELRLSHKQTEKLLRSIHDKLGTEANDIILGAAMAALGELTGETANYVTLEGHGRDGTEDEGIDLSRTIGWFTTMYPIRVETAGLVEMVIRTKEALRELRGKGLLYGAEYGYEGTLPRIVYNYFGQF
jgi:hypothetical protein